MEYPELIKQFQQVRNYIHDFYIMNYKSDSDYYGESKGRNYNNNKNFILSWLGDYLGGPDQDSAYISPYLCVDSHLIEEDPFFAVWKTKNVTPNRIFYYFLLLDVLCEVQGNEGATRDDIIRRIDRRLGRLPEDCKIFDQEQDVFAMRIVDYFRDIGVIQHMRYERGYSLGHDSAGISPDLLTFFSEAAPCGVIGSFIKDKVSVNDLPERESDDSFFFIHNHIEQALEADIMCILLNAIYCRQSIVIEYKMNANDTATHQHRIIPLSIRSMTQNGRQYVFSYVPEIEEWAVFRLDLIVSAGKRMKAKQFEKLKKEGEEIQNHMWGASGKITPGRTEHVSFTLTYKSDGEKYIPRKLKREKRCGTVDEIDEETLRFSADVFDSNELIPWMTTWVVRITSISFSEAEVEERFRENIHKLYEIYSV